MNRLLGIALLCLLGTDVSQAEEWQVPVAGNVYPALGQDSGDGLQRNGMLAWSEPDHVYSLYFHLDRPSTIKLSAQAQVSEGESTLEFSALDRSYQVVIDNRQLQSIEIGELQISEAGYVQVDIRGVSKTADRFAQIQQLIVESETPGLRLTCVSSNEGNMFYWGRRGPSVHLSYRSESREPIRFAYSELTIPEGLDPIGSYFMANGFGEGYFGIQVNSPTERRVLFSVWSPFQTDNPREIPEEQRIVLLAKGPEVRTGEFGNEGSGGQSFLVYPWRAGVTYRFLTEVKPDGKGNTIYTSWFGDKDAGEWRLIASFRRPQTDKNLTGFHSFLENFNPQTGNQVREVHYSQVWVCDTGGAWHQCNEARFSVDATGGGGHRLDFTGGSEGNHFYLRNCGFFSSSVKAGDRFERESSGRAPEIDFERLPRE